MDFIADALGMRKVGWMVAQPPSMDRTSAASAGADAKDAGAGDGSQEGDASAITMAFDFIKMAAKMQGEEGENFFTVRAQWQTSRRPPSRNTPPAVRAPRFGSIDPIFNAFNIAHTLRAP